jgi:hypothetical protein
MTQTQATRIFIRDDDVGELTPALKMFTRTFAKRGLPVSYQIIPERLTEECAAFLRDLRAEFPGLVELGQHGLRHQMMVKGKLEFYEFGPERTYEEQLADIQAGADLLRQRLGDDSALRIFTPPRHRFDRNTLKAAKALGFRVLSASNYTRSFYRIAYLVGKTLHLTNLGRPGVSYHGGVRPDSGLFEMSIAVGVDNGPDIVGTVDTTVDAIAQARPHARDLGILFHHMAYAEDGGSQFLEDLLDRLTKLPEVSFHRILDLAPQAA